MGNEKSPDSAARLPKFSQSKRVGSAATATASGLAKLAGQLRPASSLSDRPKGGGGFSAEQGSQGKAGLSEGGLLPVPPNVAACEESSKARSPQGVEINDCGLRQTAEEAALASSALKKSGMPPEASSEPGGESNGEAKSVPPLPTETQEVPADSQADTTAKAAAVERVLGLLQNISKLDTDGFFQQAVSTSEHGCENYYEHIKHPMWFSKIREKVGMQQYRTYQQLVNDFELICNNAMHFNQKRSRVHKSAVTMLRAGKKQLQAEKQALREAIQALHPEGSAVAQAEEAEEERVLRAALPPKKPPLKPPTKPPAKKATGGKGGSGQLNASGSLPWSASGGSLQHLSSLPHSMSLDSGFFDLTDDVNIDVQTEDEEAYSSFSDTDCEDMGELSRPALERTEGPILQEPWSSAAQAGPSGQASDSAATTGSRSSVWKSKGRTVEWRIRWLEHRLRELHHQQRRYETKLDQLRPAEVNQSAGVIAQEAAQPLTGASAPSERHQPPADTAAGAILGQLQAIAAESAAAVKALPEATPTQGAEAGDAGTLANPAGTAVVPMDVDAAGKAQPTSAVSAGQQGGVGSSAAKPPLGPTRGLKRRFRRLRGLARELESVEALQDHPFFAAEAGLRRNKQVVLDVEDGDVSDEDDNYPARAYASFELLERHLASLKRQLQPGGCYPPPKKMGANRGIGQPMRVSVGGRGQAGRGRLGSLAQRVALDSKPTKRRRMESSIHDMVFPQSILPKIERVEVVDITIPKVRELSSEEVQRRAAAVYSLKEEHPEEGQSPRKRGKEMVGMDFGGEGSSSEDTDDEAYATRHRSPEAVEQARYNEKDAKKKNANKKPKPKPPMKRSTQAFGSFEASMEAEVKAEPSGAVVAAIATPGSPEAQQAEAEGLKLNSDLTINIPARSGGGEDAAQDTPMSPEAMDGVTPSGTRGRWGANGGTARPRGRPPGSFRGRGGRRGRGRPPYAARGGSGPASASPRQGRPPGPGRGHKGPQARSPSGAVLSPARAAPSSAPAALGRLDSLVQDTPPSAPAPEGGPTAVPAVTKLVSQASAADGGAAHDVEADAGDPALLKHDEGKATPLGAALTAEGKSTDGAAAAAGKPEIAPETSEPAFQGHSRADQSEARSEPL